jgi:uncharacterized membrane protein YfcA
MPGRLQHHVAGRHDERLALILVDDPDPALADADQLDGDAVEMDPVGDRSAVGDEDVRGDVAAADSSCGPGDPRLRRALGRAALEAGRPLGAVVNFLDTLGIGSFAPTTAWFKFRRMVPDRLIPPTMLVGLTPPAMTESIIFLILLGVLVDPVLLFGCAIAVFAGGLVGVRLVTKARVWVVQAIVAIGLVARRGAYAMTNLHLFPGGGTANSLPPALTIVAILANFGFGILANFGVGNYAPTLVMLSLMGMDPRLCFPIMAGGASLMGAGASVKHIGIGEVDLRVVLGLAIGGIPAVWSPPSSSRRCRSKLCAGWSSSSCSMPRR